MRKSLSIREPFCGVSHGVGVLLSVAGLLALLEMADGRPLYRTGFAIYGASLIALYAASTLYHSLHASPRATAWLQRLDHCAIYLLIAGSYTPVCLIALHGAVGRNLLGAVWSIAAIGIACSLFWSRAPEWFRVVLYLVMGWLALLALTPLRAALPPAGLAWLIAGGVVYSIGAVIFAADKPHLWPGKFSAHDLWHLFVLGGSACHFVVIAEFVGR
jgi:hemolysin III